MTTTTRTRLLTASVLALALLVAGCGDADVETGDTTTTTGSGASTTSTFPDRAPDITGTITAVVPFEPITEDCTPADELDPDDPVSSDDPPVCTPEDSDVVGTILVEEEPGGQGDRKISFTITTATALAGSTGAELATFEDFAEGQSVDAWTDGPCRESYPEQCDATAVRRRS